MALAGSAQYFNEVPVLHINLYIYYNLPKFSIFF